MNKSSLLIICLVSGAAGFGNGFAEAQPTSPHPPPDKVASSHVRPPA